MSTDKSLRTLLIAFVGFLVFYLLFLNLSSIKTALDQYTHHGLTSYIIAYLLSGIPVFVGTYFINRNENILSALGLSGSLIKGLVASVIFTLPMFIGGLLFFKFTTQINIGNLLAGTIVAGFMEELYFRGFLFGQIFRNTKIGFIPVIVFGALIFASGHLYQSKDAAESAGIFMITFSGAVFFAWLYAEWKFNLWVAVFTHALMNLSWSLFEIDDTALGGITANVLRAMTIILSIVFTITYKKRTGHKFEINRQTLLWGK